MYIESRTKLSSAASVSANGVRARKLDLGYAAGRFSISFPSVEYVSQNAFSPCQDNDSGGLESSRLGTHCKLLISGAQ